MVTGEHNEASQSISERRAPLESSKLATNKLPHPKGVFRFRDFDEFNKWKDRFRCDKPAEDLP